MALSIDGKTELYGIIGNPVRHSLSPIMHNAAFASLGMNRIYVPMEVADLKQAVDGLRALHIFSYLRLVYRYNNK